jgi:PAS domain S-box-containing protein
MKMGDDEGATAADREWRSERFRRIFEATPTAMIVVGSDGAILLVNEQAERLFGYSREELVGREVEMLVPDRFRRAHPADRARFSTDPRTRAMGAGRDLFALRKDGTQVPVEIGLNPIETGAETVVLGVIIDISERKRAEEELKNINRCLERALSELAAAQGHLVQRERLTALGHLSSGIAHDLNNALAPIVGYSDLLLEGEDALDPKVTADLKIINTAAKDASNVVRRLREFVRPRDNREVFAPLDINAVVEQTVALTSPRWKDQTQAAGVTVRVATDLGYVPHVAGDASELRQALLNLVLNAVDAMPTGGTLTLSTRAARDRVEIRVRDTGVGMSAEVRQRCFEPFFSTKGERGTGLGLSQAHGIIRRHDGAIDVKSEPGQGTEFVITLPFAKESATARRGGSVAPRTPLRVLLVDDEVRPREVVRRYLELDGHVVETADGGAEALNKFRGGAFDLVVTDNAMPEMSGEQLAEEIKTRSPRTPIVLLTGFGTMMIAADKIPRHVDLCLGKPITLADWREALDKLLGARER